jgi:hypothetical protein
VPQGPEPGGGDRGDQEAAGGEAGVADDNFNFYSVNKTLSYK